MIKKFVSRSDFSLVYDALWAITAAYAKPLFVDKLGCDESVLRHNEPKEVRTFFFRTHFVSAYKCTLRYCS